MFILPHKEGDKAGKCMKPTVYLEEIFCHCRLCESEVITLGYSFSFAHVQTVIYFVKTDDQDVQIYQAGT